jgi:hypothetical protein
MQPLYTEQEFESAQSLQLLPLKCLHCTKTFYIAKRRIQSQATQTNFKADFCSQRCNSLCHKPPVEVVCEQCNKRFNKSPNQIRKTKHHFCSQSCAAKYNNAHKTKGTRISKLEKWLAIKLPELYPALEFHFNRKDTINGELDIFIPSLKLAFELNGIFHYEPIFGKGKLDSIQTNDHRKMLACAEHGIELCVIDVSTFTYFKEQRAMKFLTIVQNIINSRLSRS